MHHIFLLHLCNVYFFLNNTVLKLHTFSLSLLHVCNDYCVSFYVLFDGVWLKKAKASDSYIARLTGTKRNLTSRALQSSEMAVGRQESMVLQR